MVLYPFHGANFFKSSDQIMPNDPRRNTMKFRGQRSIATELKKSTRALQMSNDGHRKELQNSSVVQTSCFKRNYEFHLLNPPVLRPLLLTPTFIDGFPTKLLLLLLLLMPLVCTSSLFLLCFFHTSNPQMIVHQVPEASTDGTSLSSSEPSESTSVVSITIVPAPGF